MLTRKQHELLMFINQRLAAIGVAPSFDEMKDALNLRSKSGIHRLISGLEERGFIRRCDTAEDGSIVVAIVDEQEVTLKRLRRRGASIAFEPANQAYETRIFGPDRVKVQGRLVGLLRRY